METVELDDQRCAKCHKLLFRGVLGMGLIEVKCPRCGYVSNLHSFDTLLRGQPNKYILVYSPQGNIITASASASEHLGYDRAELTSFRIQDISPRNQLPVLKEQASAEALRKWEQYHIGLTSDIIHKTKAGPMLHVNARFYPVASYNGFYAVGVYAKT